MASMLRSLSLPALLLAAACSGPAFGQDVTENGETVYVAPTVTHNEPSAPSAAPTPIPVELELVLLIDSSGSVDDVEFALQRKGYVEAFRDPDVQAAIVAQDGFVVRYVEWSSRQQFYPFGWTELDTVADCERYADSLDGIVRRARNTTNMASALANTLYDLNFNRYASQRQVVDISGDGICDNWTHYDNGGEFVHDLGRPWDEVLLAREPTTTVNSISIGDMPGLQSWYSTVVPQGDESFSMHATTFEGFVDAIKVKLLREIGGVTVPLIGYD